MLNGTPVLRFPKIFIIFTHKTCELSLFANFLLLSSRRAEARVECRWLGWVGMISVAFHFHTFSFSIHTQIRLLGRSVQISKFLWDSITTILPIVSAEPRLKVVIVVLVLLNVMMISLKNPGQIAGTTSRRASLLVNNRIWCSLRYSLEFTKTEVNVADKSDFLFLQHYGAAEKSEKLTT